ncbi:acetyltransferase [Pacificimonas flava]|uniref:Acetyltransferase n=2 Tax=Pacificimonas TaxID=1960290 RepID=A0A219B1Z7_9SPHN|nr:MULTISPECIES: CatB-related O-acetyltransferase [Pacificimonas]MBZ6377994.1 CatB-related O-acetyltransferase [Pacificimonas aurantium]OWV32360.1 acetyltransferase [Pacificimonas flava]
MPAHNFPAPSTRAPLLMPDGRPHAGTVFLNAAIDHPRWDVGDYSYASCHRPPDDWAMHLAPYLYPDSEEMLRIGKFCQIADGVMFVTASANHRYDGFSSYPFAIFDGMDPARPSLPDGPFPDTVVGHDVWIGQGAKILPGAKLASGTIVGAGAVVGGTTNPYSVVAGNPAREIRRRFSQAATRRLLDLAWWDWPIDTILSHEAAICGGDLAALVRAAGSRPLVSGGEKT